MILRFKQRGNGVWLLGAWMIFILSMLPNAHAVDADADGMDDAWEAQYNFSTNAGPGIVGWWQADNGQNTNLVDRSGNNLTGSFSNFSAYPFTNALYNTGIFFQTNSYVAVSANSALNLTNAWTVSMWFKISNTVAKTVLAQWKGTNNASWVMAVGTNGIARMEFIDTGSVTQAVTATSGGLNVYNNAWTHVAAVLANSSNVTLYINGGAEVSANITNWVFSPVQFFRLGYPLTGSPNPTFTWDEGRLYGVGLTSSQILDLPGSWTDTDGDSWVNLTEYLYGGNPTNSAVPDYRISWTTNGIGSVSGASNGFLYPSGSVRTLTASPGTGFIFTNWSGGVSGTVSPTNVTMNGNKSFTVNFKDIQNPIVTVIGPTNSAGGGSSYGPDLTATNGVIATSGHGGYTGGSTLAYGPEAVIDGVLTWVNASTLTDGYNHQCLLSPVAGWLRYDFGSGNTKKIAQYRLSSSLGTSTRGPKNWTFEGSQDASGWTTLDTQNNQTTWTRGVYNTYTFNNSTGYRYYRLNVSANNGDADYTDIDEWEMMESTEAVYSTNSGSVNMTGSAYDNGTYSLTWSNLTCGLWATFSAGLTGSNNWTATGVPLVNGTNQLRVIVMDGWNNQTNDTIKVSTTGTGALGVNPTGTVNYGSVAIGASSNLNWTATNTGSAVILGSVTLNGGPYSFVGATNYALAPNGYTNIVVQYAPVTNGSFTNTMTFTGGGGATRTVMGSSPSDGNGNSIPDAWEYRYFGANYLSGGSYGAGGDPDNDGRTNGMEYSQGTIPTNAEFQLTFAVSPSGAGSVTGATSGNYYASNSVLALTATTNAGYAFTNWSGASSATTNVISLTMSGAKSVTANFRDILMPTIAITNPVPPTGGYGADLTATNGVIATSGHGGYTGGSTLAYGPEAVIDGVLTWVNASTLTDGYNHQCLLSPVAGWLRYDFGAGNTKKIEKYRLSSSLGASTRPPKNWTFEGSQDASGWSTLDTQSNQTAWTRGVYNTYVFTNNTAYRYYRLNVSANNGDADYTDIDEWEMMEGLSAIYSTNSAAIDLSGSASDNGTYNLSWTNLTSGGSGVISNGVSGSVAWIASSIPLTAGTNDLRTVIVDGGGNTTNSAFKVYTTASVVLGVTPTNGLSYGSLLVGTTSNLSFTLTNSGNMNLSGNASVNSGPFSFVGATNYTIAAGAWTNIVVQFAPVANGTWTNTVTFSGGVSNLTRWVSGKTTDADNDGMLDSWETTYGLNPFLNDAAEDPDGDGLTNLQEYQGSSNPNDFYNGILPALSIFSGDQQNGSIGTFLQRPLVVKVTGANGLPWGNAPLTYTATQGGLSATTNNFPLSTNITIRSDANGLASLFYKMSLASTNQIGVASQGGTQQATATFMEIATGPYPNGRVIGGHEFSLAMKAEGSLWSWGSYTNGRLGDGSTAIRQIPGQISFSNVVDVVAGQHHGVALKTNGTVWTWGMNDYGQLGLGDTTERTTPVQVNGISDVAKLGPNGVGKHTMVLKRDGTLWVWGQNTVGQLGLGNIAHTNLPVQVPGVSNVVAVAMGSQHTLVVKSDGKLWTCGNNYNGQLGLGDNTNRSNLVQVASISNVVDVAGGSAFSAGLKSDGTVWTWGQNGNGQLGIGNTTDQNTPVQVSNWTNVVKIAVGNFHSLALKSDGTVWSWGRGTEGQLGNGTTTVTQQTPVQVSNLTNVVSIAAGTWHGFAVKSDGTVWAWGKNGVGELGVGNTTDQNVPSQVAGNLKLQADTDGDGMPDAYENANSFNPNSAADGVQDADGDGSTNLEEYLNGGNPNNADSNGDGIQDRIALRSGISVSGNDVDGDGVSNIQELLNGTNPLAADSDGDGVLDGTDAFPLDPTRSTAPSNPSDTTAPSINLDEPTNATLLP